VIFRISFGSPATGGGCGILFYDLASCIWHRLPSNEAGRQTNTL